MLWAAPKLLTASDIMLPLLAPGVRGMERPDEWNRTGIRWKTQKTSYNFTPYGALSSSNILVD